MPKRAAERKKKPAVKRKPVAKKKPAVKKQKPAKVAAMVPVVAGPRLVDELVCGGELLDLEVNVDQLTVTVSGSVEKQELARFATWDALCAGYAAVWQGVVDEHGGEPNTMTGDEALPMDVQAEWIRIERRAGARASGDDGVWAAKLARARAELAKFTGGKAALAANPKLRGDADFSGKALAEALEYVIAIERDDGEAPLGGSKYGGRPHLPDDLEWPTHDGKPMYLLVQLALAELAAADVSGLVPPRGIVYAFITESGRGRVLYTESSTLAIRKPTFKIPTYMRRLVDAEERLTFASGFYINQIAGDIDGPDAITAALPDKLRQKIATILGCPAAPSGTFGGDRIFGGDPVDWPSMGQSYLKNPLFLQLCHGDGHQSIGVDPDDLRIAYFADADCCYCGT